MKEENQKQCEFCKEYYQANLKTCPHCHYRKPMSLNKTLWILIILLLPLTSLPFLETRLEEYNFSVSKLKVINETSERQKINIRPITQLSFLSREEIFQKRKEYVKNSIVFSNIKNYSPNEEVYQIEDNLPWISAYQMSKFGIKNNKNIYEGESRHAISVNNPELLMTFVTVSFGDDKRITKFSETSYFHPTKAFWSEEDKTIDVYFNISGFKKDYPKYKDVVMCVDETNARDLGYNWAYASENENVSFVDYHDNFSKKPYKMEGYYHKGFSCGLRSGCNNYSPKQQKMYFTILDDGYLKVKFWKEKPLSVLKNPDITYIMHFE